jgi:hypothetical protein
VQNIHYSEPRKLNQNELTSVVALVEYAAHIHGIDTSLVKSMVNCRFDAANLNDLESRDYDATIRFLVDLFVDTAPLN